MGCQPISLLPRGSLSLQLQRTAAHVVKALPVRQHCKAIIMPPPHVLESNLPPLRGGVSCPVERIATRNTNPFSHPLPHQGGLHRRWSVMQDDLQIVFSSPFPRKAVSHLCYSMAQHALQNHFSSPTRWRLIVDTELRKTHFRERRNQNNVKEQYLKYQCNLKYGSS